MAVIPKLVAFDIDGTLLGKDLIVRPRVAEAIARMLARGVAGCIVSGRMYRASLPFARALHFSAPIVCYHGAMVIDPQSDEVLLDIPLPSATALEVVAFAKNQNLHIQLFSDDRYYCEARNQYSDLYARLSGVQPIIVESLLEEFRFRDATKACIISTEEIVAGALPAAQKEFEGRAYVTRSIASFLEFVNPAVNKGRALGVVAARLGVRLEEVMAIGDSWNDAPLLEAAGFAVAMGSAPPELRALADATVADVEHDGVAEALERFVLGEAA